DEVNHLSFQGQTYGGRQRYNPALPESRHTSTRPHFKDSVDQNELGREVGHIPCSKPSVRQWRTASPPSPFVRTQEAKYIHVDEALGHKRLVVCHVERSSHVM